MIARQRAAFMELYPQAALEVAEGSSRDAVSALYGARCDLAVLSRELGQDERAAALRGGLDLEGYRFALDGLVVIAHASNAVENLALDDLRLIYQGRLVDWSELGGARGRIAPVAWPAESDLGGYFGEEVMKGEAVTVPSLMAENDSEVVARVRATPSAIGFVGLGAATEGVRVLRLASMTGLPYVAPDAESIYKGAYPLTRSFNFYLRRTSPRLAAGFVTYSTSRDGQRLVHEQGLVPASVPVRFVRRSPMIGSH